MQPCTTSITMVSPVGFTAHPTPPFAASLHPPRSADTKGLYIVHSPQYLEESSFLNPDLSVPVQSSTYLVVIFHDCHSCPHLKQLHLLRSLKYSLDIYLHSDNDLIISLATMAPCILSKCLFCETN